jgi:hypothetical protein
MLPSQTKLHQSNQLLFEEHNVIRQARSTTINMRGACESVLRVTKMNWQISTHSGRGVIAPKRTSQISKSANEPAYFENLFRLTGTGGATH